jgi:hypothetical protein
MRVGILRPFRHIVGLSLLALLAAVTVAVVVARLAALPDSALAGTSGLPRLYNSVAMHGETFTDVFSVRPRSVVVDSADGGELVVHWTQWSHSRALGHGTAHPDHGTLPIKVQVGDPIDDDFTRLTVTFKVGGKWGRPDRLILAYQGNILTWARLEDLHNPELGFTAWPN